MFSLLDRSTATSTTYWMMNDPKRGRGQGHVTYVFLNCGTLHNFWTEEARHFVFPLLDRPWRAHFTTNDEWWISRITPKWAWPGSHDLLFKFWDPVLNNFLTFFLCWIGHGKYYIRDNEWPQRGRGQGHVSYFWRNGTDTRVPQNVFLVLKKFIFTT